MAHPSPPADLESEHDFLLSAYTQLRRTLQTLPSSSPRITPTPQTLTTTLSSLPSPASPTYLHPLGPSQTLTHLLTTILPSLNHQSLSPLYLGFVTGGVLPIAEAADNLVSALDQNVQVHFPLSPTTDSPSQQWTHSASTAVESTALDMLVSLLELGTGSDWPGKTFTTGATASNILGLACGRDAVINARARARASDNNSSNTPAVTVAEAGLLAASAAAGLKGIQILTSLPHSSIAKAASIVGLGRGSVVDVGVEGEPWRLDLERVEERLRWADREGWGSVVVVGAGEVNTGGFGTRVLDMPKVRSLVDRWGGWVHVDGGEFPALLFFSVWV